MTNLPIISSTLKSPGNTANTAQTNNTADSRTTEGTLRIPVKGTPPDTRPAGGLGAGGVALAGGANSAQLLAGGGLSTFGVSNTDAAESFAALLARQIGEADSPSVNVAPGAITIDGAATSSKDEQDQAAIAAGTSGDQASTLAAMLLQLPQEMRAPIANETTSTATAAGSAAGIDASAHEPVSRADAGLDIANPALIQTEAAAIAADKRIAVVGQDVVKRAEPAASQPQRNPDTAQLIASPAASAVMPPNRLADSAQTITTPLGNSGWAGDFSQKIIWMSTQKNQVAELHLNPPDLGPLSVVLRISDNQATALFTSPHGSVREAVENAMPKLREILADNGIMLGNTTVSDQSPRNRSAEEFMNQGSGTARGGYGDSHGSSEASPPNIQTAPARRHNGLVDTFA